MYTRHPFAQAPPLPTAAPAPAAIDGLIRVEEVADPGFYVGDLFRRQFGGEPPDYPRHFVAWYRAAHNAFAVVGYLHCMVDGDLALCGGLIEDERASGRMPAPHQHALRASGGVTAHLFRGAFARLSAMPAFFGYVGEPRVRELFGAAGFAALPSPYLMVRWNAVLDDGARSDLVRRVTARGAF